MIKADLRINQRVKIKISQKGPYSGCYSSRVEDISPDRIVFAAPLKNNKIVPLQEGDEIKIEYSGNSVQYSFTTRVVHTKTGHIPMVTVESPKMIRRWQRRRFLRMKAKLPVTLTRVRADDSNSSPEIYQVESIDISGGGIMVRSPIRFHDGECLELEITLPHGGLLEALGKVVRVEEKVGGGDLYYMTGIEFMVIRESDRQQIISYVFELQRQKHRRHF